MWRFVCTTGWFLSFYQIRLSQYQTQHLTSLGIYQFVCHRKASYVVWLFHCLLIAISCACTVLHVFLFWSCCFFSMLFFALLNCLWLRIVISEVFSFAILLVDIRWQVTGVSIAIIDGVLDHFKVAVSLIVMRNGSGGADITTFQSSIESWFGIFGLNDVVIRLVYLRRPKRSQFFDSFVAAVSLDDGTWWIPSPLRFLPPDRVLCL